MTLLLPREYNSSDKTVSTTPLLTNFGFWENIRTDEGFFHQSDSAKGSTFIFYLIKITSEIRGRLQNGFTEVNSSSNSTRESDLRNGI